MLEPELDDLAAEILAAIAEEVPEYARPLEGSFGRGIRVGVTEALSRFVSLIRDPGQNRDPGSEVYVALGRGELRQGRSLDSLQAAYRVGARVAWRRAGEAGNRAGIAPEVLYSLAEAMFAYIDELSSESVEGYAAEQSTRRGELERRRELLVAALVGERPPERTELERLAADAGWAIPETVAALACAPEQAARIAGRIGAVTLAADIDGVGCVVVADPEGPGVAGRLEVACRKVEATLGPTARVVDSLGPSWEEARAVHIARRSGAIETAESPAMSGELLLDLILAEAAPHLARISALRLAAFDQETERSRERLLETLQASLRHQGAISPAASELHVHPQTVRYRMAKLREILGDQLEDPDARLELELILRAGRQGARRE